MHIEDAARSHRAVKGYDSSFNLTREEKDHLLDLTLHAPFTPNLRHVRLVETSDPQLCTQLREVIWDQAQVTDAAILVVVCVQLDDQECNAQRVWDGAPEAVQAFMADAIDTCYRSKPQVQRDETMRSRGLLAQVLMLVTRGRGLDPCPTDGFDFDAVVQLINLPNDHVIGLMVTVGKKTVEPWPHSSKPPREGLVIRDRFWLPEFPQSGPTAPI